MTKKNSLKLVPYAIEKRYDYRNDQPLPSRRFLMEYTDGAPGEQKKLRWRDEELIEWRENIPFEATLTLDRLERGRSAARFWFVGDDGTEYPVFGQGLVEMLQGGTLDKGVIAGTWIAVKRGANYGIERYEG